MPPILIWLFTTIGLLLFGCILKTYAREIYDYIIKPLPPLPEESRKWLDDTLLRLADEYGEDHLRKKSLILAEGRFDPRHFSGTEDDAYGLFNAVCDVYGIKSKYLEFEVRPTSEAAGLYIDSYTQKVILAEDALEDFSTTVAVLAHEVAHVRLFRDSVCQKGEEFLEELTDLTALFFGFGFFIVQAYKRRIKYYSSHGHMITPRMGYLRFADISYAMGLFTWIRKECDPEWIKRLDEHDAQRIRHVIGYLKKTNDSIFCSSYAEILSQPINSIDQDRLQTLLQEAVAREDYEYAASVKKLLDECKQ